MLSLLMCRPANMAGASNDSAIAISNRIAFIGATLGATHFTVKQVLLIAAVGFFMWRRTVDRYRFVA
jgi:hypothetical protein